MRAFFSGIAACLVLGACAGGAVPGLFLTTSGVSAEAPYIQAAIADARRPAEDLARDMDRRPADIMAFAGVRPGQAIADVGPGGGYYTRLLSVAVGEAGHVYGIERPNPADGTPRRILAVAPSYPNVTIIQQGYQGWTVPMPLDTIFISQIYHDFHLTALNLDIAALNRGMFAALKPGGALIVIDHAAVDGSDASVPNALHRIDQGLVRRELEAAGFVYVDETQVLRNPADDRTARVFDGVIRGHTDQFAMRFRKPG